MRQLRILVILLTLGVMLAGMIGCGKKGASSAKPEPYNPNTLPTAAPLDPPMDDAPYEPPKTAPDDGPLLEPAVPRATSPDGPPHPVDDTAPHPTEEAPPHPAGG